MIVGVNLIWIFPGLSRIENNASLFQLEIAKRVSAQISGFFGGIGTVMKNSAEILIVPESGADSALPRLLNEEKSVVQASFFDLEGVEKASMSQPESETADLRTRFSEPVFKEVVRTEDIVFGNVFFSSRTSPFMEVGVPVISKEAGLIGVLTAKVKLDFVIETVKEAKFGKEGRVVVVDAAGNVAARSESDSLAAEDNLIGLRAVSDVVRDGKTVTGLEENERYVASNGRKMFIAGVPLEIADWGVMAEMPEDEAFDLKARFYTLSFVSLGSAVVLLLILGYIIYSLLKTGDDLERERDQMTAIITRLADGLLVYDEDAEIKLMNPRAENILRVKFSEVAGRRIAADFIKDKRFGVLASVFHPRLLDSFKPISGGEGKYPEISEIAFPETDTFLQIITAPLKDEPGQKKEFIKVVRDVSRERFISQMKSEFISIAAHQLRTPLSAIKWTLKMMLAGEFGGGLTPEQKLNLERAQESNDAMIKLINDLLNISRIEEGRFGYNFKEQDLFAFIKEVTGSMQIEFQKKGINLVFRFPAETAKAFFDPDKLIIALSSIVENAINYNKPNGTIIISARAIPEFLEIKIEDTGAGIPKEEMSRLFTRFFRGSNVKKTPIGGTGLGLFIAKSIILNHGGNIRVESEEGKGTAVYFTISTSKANIAKKEVAFEEFVGGL